MKKIIIILTIVATTLIPQSCKKQESYFSKISQLRENIFFAECDNYCIRCYTELRENPNLDDGNPSETKPLVTFKLTPKDNFDAENKQISVEYSYDGKKYSGNFEFKPLSVTRYAYINVDKLPSENFKVVISVDGKQKIMRLTSKRRGDLIDYKVAISNIKNQSKGTLDDYFKEDTVGEIKIRLIENDDYNFWYVGFFDGKNCNSYLVDGLSGEILATKKD